MVTSTLGWVVRVFSAVFSVSLGLKWWEAFSVGCGAWLGFLSVFRVSPTVHSVGKNSSCFSVGGGVSGTLHRYESGSSSLLPRSVALLI